MNYKLISIDLAKTVFQVAAFNSDNSIAFNRKVKRTALLDTLRQCAPTHVVMEACYSSNYWGRAIQALGHDVHLIPPKMVKAMLVGNKNDANDAVAIGETASRPKVTLLRPKTVEQQDIQSLLRIRERLVDNRSANCNQLRGFLGKVRTSPRTALAYEQKRVRGIQIKEGWLPFKAEYQRDRDCSKAP